MVRIFVPKLFLTWAFGAFLFYLAKYESVSWERLSGVGSHQLEMQLDNRAEIEEKHPGLIQLGAPDPSKYRYFDSSFDKRAAIFDVGETQRPW